MKPQVISGGPVVVKKADRQAKFLERQAERERSAREEDAMQSFLVACRESMPAPEWDKEYAEADRSAGSTLHVVESMVAALAASEMPIPPRLRLALDRMLEALGVDRGTTRWERLRHLNYGPYWKSVYGY